MKSPDHRAALAALVEGNRRFAAGVAEHPRQDARRREEVLARGQYPFAAIVGCADSRVPPEIVFDQGLGDLFVLRTAGNIVDDLGVACLEYAAAHLGVPLIVVMGHSRCGAVTAAAELSKVTSIQDNWFPYPVGYEAPELTRVENTLFRLGVGFTRSF